MPVIAPRMGFARSPAARRGAAVAAGLGVVAALSVAALSNAKFAEAVGDGVNQSVNGVKTVAAMLAERSPGERPDGALASLKPKKAVLNERALPKVPAAAAPPSPFAALAGPPPAPPLVPPPAAVPLFNSVAGGPPEVIPPPGGGGGPPVLSEIPPPGGGGGGIIAPPIITTTQVPPPTTPSTPSTPLPEPGTWGMMLIGFALIGGTLRRIKRAARQLSTE
ncbi:MAG: PEPxxWA-CTERM sorting domain-containing protein [Sphingomonas sp.]